jgi:hypothetical protein
VSPKRKKEQKQVVSDRVSENVRLTTHDAFAGGTSVLSHLLKPNDGFEEEEDKALVTTDMNQEVDKTRLNSII